MNFKNLIILAVMSAAITSFAQRPVVELIFDDSVVNYGYSGGVGEIVSVNSVTPVVSPGGMDGTKCLDITSAPSMGSTGGYVRFPTTSAVADGLSNLRSFTITGWMKSSAALSNLAGLASFATADSGFRLRGYSNNRLQFMIDTPDTVAQYFYSSTAANYGCTEWKFFAAVYDGTKSTDNVKLYYAAAGGQLYLDSVHSYGGGTLFMSPAILYIGNVNGSGTSVFDGLLDSVRVFGSKSDASGALDMQQIADWKDKNTLEPVSVATIDMRFEDNTVIEGRFNDIAFIRDYNGTLPQFSAGGIDGGKCLDLTVATGMGTGFRGPFLGFTETYGVNDYIYNSKGVTISGWLKTPVVPQNGARLFSHLDGSGRGIELYFGSAGRLSLSAGPFVFQSSAAANYTCGDWTFFAVTFDGVKTANNVNFYYGLNDGTGQVFLDSTYTTTLRQLLGDKAAVNIGNRGTILPFDGLMDSFKVFTSKDDAAGALTAAMISEVKTDNATGITPPGIDNKFRKSDVAIMRTSSALPTDGYRATRIVWNYSYHNGLIDSFAALGVAASQTHNFESTSYDGTLNYLSGKYYTNDSTMPSRTRDIEGGLVEKNGYPAQYYPSVSSQAYFDDTAGRLVDVLIPLNPYNIQYDTPSGDRHAMSLGYPVGFDASTLEGFRNYLAGKYSASQLSGLFDIANISTFNYKRYLADKFGITTNAAYKSQLSSIALTPELEYYLEDNNVVVIDALRQLVNSSPRNAKISGNCGLFRRYGRVLMPYLDFFNSELPKAKVLGVLDSRDSVVCSIAEAYDKPYYGVNNCDVTAYLMNNLKPNYMNCLIAAVYANGGVMQTPWNIWAGGELRYFGSWEQYGAFFAFVRDNAAWFDDYKPKSQLAILWNCDNEIDELYTIAQTVYNMNIPFDVLLLGDRYPYSRIDVDAVAAKYQQVVLGSSINTFSASNQATVNELASKISVAAGAAQISLAEDWIQTAGQSIPTTWILPRRHTEAAGSDIVVHVLNRSYSSSTDLVNLAGMNIGLHKDVFNGLAVKGVAWAGPQTPQTELVFTQTSGGISVDIPKTPIWSILKISVYSPADINTDGVVDLYDFAVFAKSWSDCYGNSSCTDAGADFNNDGAVDIDDLYMFVSLWID